MAAFISRAAQRYISVSAAKASAGSGSAATAGGHGGGAALWKKLTFFVAFPTIGLAMVNTYLKHQEDHHKPRPEFVPYEHLRIRTKRFPWGDGNKTFFHNPRVNALPNGYEEGSDHH